MQKQKILHLIPAFVFNIEKTEDGMESYLLNPDVNFLVP